MSVSRSEIGKTKLDQMFQYRAELNDRIKTALNKATSDWGIECFNYEVLEIVPPQKIRKALRDVAEAERIKRKDIIISEAEKDYQIEISKAQKIAKIIQEEGKAEEIKIKASEMARGMKSLNSQLQKGSDQFLMNFLVYEKYID